MARGADTMALSVSGWTPLSLAIYLAITSSREENQSAKAGDLHQIARSILNAENFKAEHIDAVNDEEGTALHYATAYAMPELVLLLLKRGARMYRQGSGQMHQFQEEHLESFLDTCISYESQGKKVSECSLQFNYTFLNNSLEAKIEVNNAAKEGEVVVDLKSVNEPEELKNDTTRPEEETISPPSPQEGGFTLKNSILKTTFGGTSAIEKVKDTVCTVRTETTVLEDMAAQHRNLLKHPLPRAFLMLKWRKINNIYKTWIVMKAIFLGLLVAIVAQNLRHCQVKIVKEETSEKPQRLQNFTEMAETELDTINYLLLLPLSLLLIIFASVELLQFLVSPHTWLLELKSWLQLSLLTASALLFLFIWRATSTKEEVVRQVVAYLLPLSYYEFLHELGCHPRFSKYILLFKRISVKFVKYTSIYIGLVIMCAFSFSVMITREEFNVDTEEGLVSMILSTILMFIGEVGAPTFSKEFFTAQVAPKWKHCSQRKSKTFYTRSCSSLALSSSL